MNAPFAARPDAPLPRAPRKYTADDIYFFLEAGLLDPAAKFELFDGEIVPMSPKGRHHEVMRERLMSWLDQPWRKPFNLMVEHTLKLDVGTLLDPDFIFYDADRRIADAPLSGSEIRLMIEVANHSWAYDTKRKAKKYAESGIQEYWVIHAARAKAKVYREASAKGWAEVADVNAGERLSPLCASHANFPL